MKIDTFVVMPVTTRRHARLLARQPCQPNQGISQGELSPDVTVNRSEQISRQSYGTTLEDLPDELIQLIAENLQEDDFDPSWDTSPFESYESDELPPCRCQPLMTDKPDETVRSSPRTLDNRIPFSSTSRRLRNIIFNQTHRIKLVKWCKASIQSSKDVSPRLRGNVRKLTISANPRHTPPELPIQPIDYLKLFPNIDLVNIHWQRQCSETTRAFDVSEQLLQFENLKTFWLEIHKDEQRGDIPGQGPDVLEEDFGWELKEMEMIFEHLPLSHLKELEIYIGSPIDHARIELQSIAMQNALASMRFPELEYFGYRGQIELLGDLPQRSLWPEIEKAIEEFLRVKQYCIKTVVLGFTIAFFMPSRVNGGDEFFLQRDGQRSLIPHIMPDRQHLLDLFERLKAKCPHLESFRFELDGYNDKDTEKTVELINFRICTHDTDDHAFHASACTNNPTNHASTTAATPEASRLKGVYEVDQAGIDYLATMMQDEIVPQLID